MQNDVKDTEAIIADSRLAFMQGRYEESLRLAKEALKQDSSSADAHQCAGNAYMSKQDYDAAIKHYQKAVDADRNTGDRYFNLAYAYASANQPANALAMFAKADEVGCSPNVVGQLYKIMAMLCFDMQSYEDAILNFQKAEKIIGIDMDILQRKALAYSLSGYMAKGIETANQVKLVSPTSYIGYRLAFNILLQQNRLEDCEKELGRAERFANLTPEYYFDWLSYETARFKLEGDESHLIKALDKINEGLLVLKPSTASVIDSYINAAEVYVELRKGDMAVKCLNASENPIVSFNSGFSVLETEDIPLKPDVRMSSREIDGMVRELRRRVGDREIDRIGRDLSRNPKMNVQPDDERLTPPVEENGKAEENAYLLDREDKAVYSAEKLDHIYRLYVAAYTLKEDIPHIKMYASKLANSSDQQSKYIGRYALVKALKDDGDPSADEEYRRLLKFLRSAAIKDPSDLLALNFRVQCCIDMGEYDEAEKLCQLLSEEMKKPLMEQISKARAGGES